MSTIVDRDLIKEMNSTVPFQADDQLSEDERQFALTCRLRCWNEEVTDVESVVGDEVRQAIAAGQIPQDMGEEFAERMVGLLVDDGSLSRPWRDEQVLSFQWEAQRLYDNVHRQHLPDIDPGAPQPFQLPDEYGNWPGKNWLEAVEHSMALVSTRLKWGSTPTDAVSLQFALAMCRGGVLAEAKARHAAERQRRAAKVDSAVQRLPVEFDDERQAVLKRAVMDYVAGKLQVPVSGDHIGEAFFMETVAMLNDVGLSQNDLADVVTALIRFVVTEEQRDTLVTPRVGYAVVRHGSEIAGVAPGVLWLTITGKKHVLQSARWSQPVQMSARDFRCWRRSSQAIYDAVGVEVDCPKGFWKKWWPSLSAQLLAAARTAVAVDRTADWDAWLRGKVLASPVLKHAPVDGSLYRTERGEAFVQWSVLTKAAIDNHVLQHWELGEFSAWLGGVYRNRRDAKGVQHKLLALPTKPSITHEGVSEDDKK